MWPKTISSYNKLLLLIYQILFVKFSSLTAFNKADATTITKGGNNHHTISEQSSYVSANKNDEWRMTRESEDEICQYHSLCKDEDIADESAAPFFPQSLILGKQQKNLEEAKEIANKSANELLEILKKFGEAFNGNCSSQIMMSAEEFAALMASTDTPISQLFGDSFGTIFTGVRESLVSSTDPVLKAITELNKELDRHVDADAGRLNEMIRQFWRTTICYNAKVTCVMDSLQPFYIELTSIPAIIDYPETYAKTVDKFLAICKPRNIAYSAVDLMYDTMLKRVYDDDDKRQQERENLLSAAKMIQIHAIKVLAMATLCAEFQGMSDVFNPYLTKDMSIILNGMGSFILQKLLNPPPSPSTPPDSSNSSACTALHHSIWHSNSHQQLIILFTGGALSLLALIYLI